MQGNEFNEAACTRILLYCYTAIPLYCCTLILLYRVPLIEGALIIKVFVTFDCRLQNQGAPSKDQHVHQDAGARRGAGVRGDRPEGGRGPRETRDPLGCGALLSDPSVAQELAGRAARRATWTAGVRSGPRDDSGTSPVQSGRSGGRAEGCDHQENPASDAHLHSDAQPRQGAGVRGDRAAGERGGGQARDRGAHRPENRDRAEPRRIGAT